MWYPVRVFVTKSCLAAIEPLPCTITAKNSSELFLTAPTSIRQQVVVIGPAGGARVRGSGVDLTISEGEQLTLHSAALDQTCGFKWIRGACYLV